MFALLVLVAILAIIAQGASEVVNSHPAVKAAEDVQKELIRKAMNHFGVDGSKASLEEAPRSLRHTERKLGGGSFYTFISSYYQGQMYMDSNHQPTCSTSGTPVSGVGVGMGCYSISVPLPPGQQQPAGMPQSVQMTCAQGDSGSITMAAVMWSGANCDGSVVTTPGASFSQVMPACSSTNGYLWQTCAGTSTTGPASLYSGYRATTYLDSAVCMGSPFSYVDIYNSATQSYTCDAGNIYVQFQGLSSPTLVAPVSCTGMSSMQDPTNPAISYPMSTGSGCISASSSVSVRTYQQWTMTQKLNGVPASTWKSIPANTISAVAAFADLYGINYEFISAISFQDAGSNAANLVYTICVQPGYGNSYTTADVYSSLVGIAQNAVDTTKCNPAISASNTNPCLANLIMNRGTANSASPAIQNSLSLPVGGGFLGATQPQTVTTGLPTGGGGGGGTSSNGTPSGGSNAGAIVGALIAVAIICGAIYYYQYVYLKAATDAAAKATFDADSVKNPVAIGAPVAPAAPGAMPRK